jgi:ribulose kinase
MQSEASTLGAAILASVGSGFYRDAIEASSQIFSTSEEYHPNLENKKKYDAIYGNYVKLSRELDHFYY